MTGSDTDHPDDLRLWLARVRDEAQVELTANEERRVRLAELTEELRVMRQELIEAVDERQALAEEILAMQQTRAWRFAVLLRRIANVGRRGRTPEPPPAADSASLTASVEPLPEQERAALAPTVSLRQAPRRAPSAPSVSVIIPTKDRPDLVQGVLDTLAIADWPDLEVVFVDNNTTDPDAAWLLRECGHIVVRDAGGFNFPRLVQSGVQASRGEVLLILNNDIVTEDPEWVSALVECLQVPGCGIAGALLLTSEGAIQHCGISLTGGQPAHALAGSALGEVPRHLLEGIHPRTAVTGACLAIRRETWDALGGMDPLLAHNFNDIDLCLRARRAGLDVLCSSKAEITHLESATRGPAWSPQAAADWLLFRSRWKHELATRDPFLPATHGDWARGDAAP